MFSAFKSFLELGSNSVEIGIFAALLNALILKRFRIFKNSAVHECVMIFAFGYIAYLVSEMYKYSGIITLLVSGIVMSHYSWYNLSPQGRFASYFVFHFLGYATEAFVFGYLGLTFFSYASYTWSSELFVVELFIIIFGRAIGTMGLMAVARLFGYDSKLEFKELVFIWYAGMIRGAIAFGLVLKIDDSHANSEVIITTSLALVVFTTVVFGSTVGLLSKHLLGDKIEAGEE
jgi:NhaP-type Na+/H+ or K+/H+ antiporter